MKYNLKIQGPYKICDETCDVLEKCEFSKNEGIYLWAVKMSTGKYRLTYIGETSASFYKRTKEHIIQTLGGNYQVCDADAMLKGEHKIIWNGLWRKGTRNKLPEFIKKYQKLALEIKNYLMSQVLFVIPFKTDRRSRQRIEAAIAKAILNDKEASSIMPKDIRFYYKKDKEEPIEVTIESSKIIEGLPEKIKA
jgi:hypothetical protein